MTGNLIFWGMNMGTYNISGHVLHTRYECPSIPVREWDWCCVDDNYDGAPDAGPQIVGTGRTELEAIYNYLEQII